MNELFRRLRYLLHRRRFDDELANDMEFHREMAVREGVRFGSTLRLREEARDAWGWTWIDRLCQDVRYAARQLRKSPGFTLAAVLMLAIGIGVNVAAFGFFDLMVLRPLPVDDPVHSCDFIDVPCSVMRTLCPIRKWRSSANTPQRFQPYWL